MLDGEVIVGTIEQELRRLVMRLSLPLAIYEGGYAGGLALVYVVSPLSRRGRIRLRFQWNLARFVCPALPLTVSKRRDLDLTAAWEHQVIHGSRARDAFNQRGCRRR